MADVAAKLTNMRKETLERETEHDALTGQSTDRGPTRKHRIYKDTNERQ